MNCEENIEIAWVSNYKEIATAKIRADEWRDDRTKTMEFMTLKDTDGQAVAVVNLSAMWIGDMDQYKGFKNVKKHDDLDE